MNIDQIIENRKRLFTAGNDAGDGYSPDDDIQGLVPAHVAAETDDVSVYVWSNSRVILVGTDGSGDASSQWGVTVAMDGE